MCSTPEPEQSLHRLLGENCLLRLGATGPLGIITAEEPLPGRLRAHETPRSEPYSPLPASLPTQPMEVFVDDETKLTLHGLQQYYVKLKDSEKNRKLFDLLDVLEFNQVMLAFAHTKIWAFGVILHGPKQRSPSLSGGDLCQVCAALHGPGPAPSGAEFPSHCYSPRHGPGGAVST